jgi:hypothetical protein
VDFTPVLVIAVLIMVVPFLALRTLPPMARAGDGIAIVVLVLILLCLLGAIFSGH